MVHVDWIRGENPANGVFEHLVASRMFAAWSVVDPEDSLELADAAMRLARLSHLPVAEAGELVGIVSLRAVLAGEAGASEDDDEPGRSDRVSCVMSPPVAVRPDDTLVEAAEIVCRHHLSCLPVVDGDRLVGVLTAIELARYAIELLDREAAQLGAAPTVARLMTPGPVVTVRPTDPLAVAEVLMRHGHVRHLPVMEGERLVGILAQREALAGLRSDPDLPVAEVMTRPPLQQIDPEAAAAAGARLLVEQRIGALPVIDSAHLVGILTKSDFLTYVVESARPTAAQTKAWGA